MICSGCQCNFPIRVFPFVCNCGTVTLADGSTVKTLQMSLETAAIMREKLGLSAYGAGQKPIEPFKITKPEKPEDLPEELIQWLNKYEQEVQEQ